MQLELKEVSRTVGGVPQLYPLTLALAPGRINVLLGATQAGKTTLMRLIAGLDRPTVGRVFADGVDVTGVSVRRRNLAMVYQQFINYPSLTVFENIASPLRLQNDPRQAIAARVQDIAAKLHIDHLLDRLPTELSGGQQQRTALARALVKGSKLVLLDEPLVNLDYKLREELRTELAGLFSEGGTTVVYATTEPQEALLLGGHTAVLDKGRLLQFGPTLEVYRNPASVEVAIAFNDPPLNIVAATALEGGAIRLADGATVPLERPVRRARTRRTLPRRHPAQPFESAARRAPSRRADGDGAVGRDLRVRNAAASAPRIDSAHRPTAGRACLEDRRRAECLLRSAPAVRLRCPGRTVARAGRGARWPGLSSSISPTPTYPTRGGRRTTPFNP